MRKEEKMRKIENMCSLRHVVLLVVENNSDLRRSVRRHPTPEKHLDIPYRDTFGGAIRTHNGSLQTDDGLFQCSMICEKSTIGIVPGQNQNQAGLNLERFPMEYAYLLVLES